MPGNDLIESYGQLSNNSYVKNLGVFFDSEIRFDRQVNSVVKTSFFLLRKLSKLKSILSYKDLEIVLHAFISTWLDYCNALYLGISESLVACLQYVQNAAARILTNTKTRSYNACIDIPSLVTSEIQNKIQGVNVCL